MARRHALPPRLAHINPRYRTPDVSTWLVAGIAIAWYVGIYQVSANALFDSLTALSLLIAFYYALTGVACAVYHRKHLTESPKNLLLIGVGPVVGAIMLTWLLVLSVRDMSDPANSYSGQSWLGVGPPLVIGVGIFLVGVAFMFYWRCSRRPVLAGAPEPARPRRGAWRQGRRQGPRRNGGLSDGDRARLRRLTRCRHGAGHGDPVRAAPRGAAGAGLRRRGARRARARSSARTSTRCTRWGAPPSPTPSRRPTAAGVDDRGRAGRRTGGRGAARGRRPGTTPP